MAPAFETLRVVVDGRRGRLTLANPAKLNPLSLTALHEIVAAAAWFNEQSEVRVVVVSGEGRAFTGGADLEMFSGAVAGSDDLRAAADAGTRMADAVERMEAVTVAAIHGHCVGGGVVLAAACDLRIAAEETVFSIPEVDLGIPLGWGGIPRLVREVGPAIAKEIVMTGRPFTAAEARRIGFVNRVVRNDQLDAEVDELAGALAAKARLALLSTKRHVNAVTAQMVGIDRSHSDADSLLIGLFDPEGRKAAAEYLARRRTPGD